jgi:hypothetical protein
MNPIQQQIDTLVSDQKRMMDEIQRLRNIVESKSNGQEFEELVRGIVIFNSDTSTSIAGGTVSVVTGVNFGAQTTSTTNIASTTAPTLLLKVYFRGTPYNIPAYAVS